MKAYLVRFCGIEVILSAESAIQARAIAARDAKKAGWEVDYINIRIRRKPEADARAYLAGLGSYCREDEFAHPEALHSPRLIIMPWQKGV